MLATRIVSTSLVAALAACGGGSDDRPPVAAPGEGWPALLEKNAATYAAVDPLVANAIKLIDKVPDGATGDFATCRPSPERHFTHAGAGPHDTDVLIGGDRLLLHTPLQRVLFARKANQKATVVPTPDQIADFARVRGVKNLVYVRERKASQRTQVLADVFLVGGEPLAIQCAFALDGVAGQVTGSEAVRMRETTYDRKTLKTVGEREYTTGGYSQADAIADAQALLEVRLVRKLGIAVSAAAAKQPSAPEAFSLDLISAVLKKEGSTVAPKTEKTFGQTTEWTDIPNSIYVSLYHLTVPKGDILEDRTAFAIGPEVAVRVLGPMAVGKELATALAKQSLPSAEAIAAALATLGFKIAPKTKVEFNESYYHGRRYHGVSATRGTETWTVTIIDYAEAAKGKTQSAVRRDDTNLLIVTRERVGYETVNAMARQAAGD